MLSSHTPPDEFNRNSLANCSEEHGSYLDAAYMYFQSAGFPSLIHSIAVSTLRFLVSRFHFLAERAGPSRINAVQLILKMLSSDSCVVVTPFPQQ